MTMLAEKIKRKALALSVSERANIAHELILSLDDPSNFELDEEQEYQIQRRVKMVKEGKAVGQPADQVFAEIESKLT